MKTLKITDQTHCKIKKLQAILFEYQNIKLKTLSDTIEYAVELLVEAIPNDK